jgi:hypothetical protein
LLEQRQGRQRRSVALSQSSPAHDLAPEQTAGYVIMRRAGRSDFAEVAGV